MALGGVRRSYSRARSIERICAIAAALCRPCPPTSPITAAQVPPGSSRASYQSPPMWPGLCGRKPRRRRVGADVIDPQGFWTGYQISEQAASLRKGHTGQVGHLPLRQADRNELGQMLAVLIQDAQSAVAGIDQVHRGIDDL